MSVLRRLYNVAYGKIRSWGSDDGLEDLPELESARSRTRLDPTGSWTGLRSGSVAEESVARLREELSRLEAEARLDREPVRRTGGIRREPEPEPETEAPPAPAKPRQRRL